MSEFDLRVNREGLASLKHEFTPPQIRAQDIEAFNAAEMDFSTAPCVKKALHEMIDRGIFGFTVQTPEYDGRIAWWMKETRGMEIDPRWIVPVMGTIFSVATALRMTCEPDGRLIVLSPVYYRYEQAASRMGLETVRVPLKNDSERFSIDFAALETAMADPKNRLLVLCNPHNPTGNVWPEEDLRKIAILSAKTQTVVLSDEIFANDAFDGRRVTPYIAIEEGRPYAITCVSLGKSFNYTGVNHADLLIPDDALRERYVARKYADHFGSIGPFEYTSIVSAYTPEGLAWQRQSLAYMDGNRRIVEDFFRTRLAPNRVYPMEGAFVGFIEWRGLKLKGEELHSFLEKEAMAVLEPGDHYAPEYAGYSRINLGSTHEQTRALLERIEAAIARHPEIRV